MIIFDESFSVPFKNLVAFFGCDGCVCFLIHPHIDLLDHGLSPRPGVARWQHRLTGLQQRLFAGCHLERDIAGRVERAGFAVTALEPVSIPGPSVLNHVVSGRRGRDAGLVAW